MLGHMAHQPDQALARAIAEVLQEVRGRGMTTRAIADWFGVSDPTVTRWESGARQPALDLLPSFDRLAGQDRGYVLRLAGYVTDPGAASEFKPDKDDPEEMAIWNRKRIPEEFRRRWILELRETNGPPKPAKRAPRKATVRKTG
jgi:transcriptional regulator with XRE-family HTH domain